MIPIPAAAARAPAREEKVQGEGNRRLRFLGAAAPKKKAPNQPPNGALSSKRLHFRLPVFLLFFTGTTGPT